MAPPLITISMRSTAPPTSFVDHGPQRGHHVQLPRLRGQLGRGRPISSPSRPMRSRSRWAGVAGSDPTGADETTFVIERCTGGPDGCLTEVAVIAKVQGMTWFLDSGLQPATPYTYRRVIRTRHVEVFAVHRRGIAGHGMHLHAAAALEEREPHSVEGDQARAARAVPRSRPPRTTAGRCGGSPRWASPASRARSRGRGRSGARPPAAESP